MSELIKELQKDNPSEYIQLFTLDASTIGGGIFRWANCVNADGSNIKYNNIEYPPLNFVCEGFAWDSDTPPRPKITASIASDSNLPENLISLAIGYKGGQGAFLYRTITFSRFLDGESDGGQSIAFPTDTYIIDRITNLNQSMIQWELITPFELPHCELPARQALRDYCPWIYRSYNTDSNSFDYSTASTACPYTGSSCYTKLGVSTTADKDVCGHKLSDCILRYGYNPLPFGGFAGLNRGDVS